MFCIRKPLSRKFNIICLNLAGLLARSMLLILPIQKMNSGFVESNILNIEVPKQVWHKHTVAGTAPVLHRIPF